MAESLFRQDSFMSVATATPSHFVESASFGFSLGSSCPASGSACVFDFTPCILCSLSLSSLIYIRATALVMPGLSGIREVRLSDGLRDVSVEGRGLGGGVGGVEGGDKGTSWSAAIMSVGLLEFEGILPLDEGNDVSGTHESTRKCRNCCSCLTSSGTSLLCPKPDKCETSSDFLRRLTMARFNLEATDTDEAEGLGMAVEGALLCP